MPILGEDAPNGEREHVEREVESSELCGDAGCDKIRSPESLLSRNGISEKSPHIGKPVLLHSCIIEETVKTSPGTIQPPFYLSSHKKE
jgi:hypothetical protein